MNTWRIEFTEAQLIEIYYALRDKAEAPSTNGDKAWRRELRQIAQQIIDAGVSV